MAFLQFPQVQMIEALDTSEKMDLGAFQPAKSGELQYVTITIMKVGSLSNAASLKIGLHLQNDFTSAYAFSDDVLLVDVEAATALISTDTWQATVRFTFNRISINLNQEYRLSLQSTSYTRTGDTNYIGVVRDEPYPIYSLAGANYGIEYPAKKALFAYQLPD